MTPFTIPYNLTYDLGPIYVGKDATWFEFEGLGQAFS